MTQRTPTVTVLMPVYNGARFLRESIESILNQTFNDFECLIIDDASTDTSREIIRSFTDPRIKLIENANNCGLVKTLNRGLALAKGEYIARQDQDDISYPARLEKQVTFLNSHPQIVLLGTNIHNIDENGKKSISYGYSIVSTPAAIHWQIIFDNPFVHSSVMFRTEIIRNLGGYNDHFNACEDFDLFSRVCSSYGTTNLNEKIIEYRYHSASMIATSTKANNLLIGEILSRNYRHTLNLDAPPEWIELWLTINNPYNFQQSVDAKKLVHHIQTNYRQFISRYPDAKDNAEIKRNITHMLIRSAFNLALKDRGASLYCFYQVMKKDLLLSCSILPKYFFALVCGCHRALISQRIKTFFTRFRIKWT